LHFFLDARARYAVVRGHAEFDTELEAAVPGAQAGAKALPVLHRPVLPGITEKGGEPLSSKQNSERPTCGLRWCRHRVTNHATGVGDIPNAE
jgi:hypothetical protein